MAAVSNTTVCPVPFLPANNYPPTGGELSSRFCAQLGQNLTCCLPCPITDWVFADNFPKRAPAANYVAIFGFVVNVLLLLTYAALPEEKSHRHYLSIGLTVSLILLSLAFIIPLGTKPDFCHDALTPNNMYTDVGCGFTGAFFLAGAMGTMVWIFLRSVWTALRIVFDFKRIELFKWVSISLGIGLPALFLGITLPLTGVSYRFYDVCLPSGQRAFVTWFVWLLAFAAGSAIILIATIAYCIWKFALSALAGAQGSTHRSTRSMDTTLSDTPESGQKPSRRAMRRRKKVEWARIKKVLILQWRTIMLAFIVLNETIFFSLVFVQQTGAAEATAHGITPADLIWSACLILNGGDKNACLNESTGLGLSEPRVVAMLLLMATLGPIVFLLMLRWSMFVGWYELLSHPRQILHLFQGRRPSVGDDGFIIQSTPKHLSLTKPLASDEQKEQLATPVKQRVPQGKETAESKESARSQSDDVERADSHESVVKKDEAEVMV